MTIKATIRRIRHVGADWRGIPRFVEIDFQYEGKTTLLRIGVGAPQSDETSERTRVVEEARKAAAALLAVEEWPLELFRSRPLTAPRHIPSATLKGRAQSVCSRCGGSGRVGERACPQCHGEIPVPDDD